MRRGNLHGQPEAISKSLVIPSVSHGHHVGESPGQSGGSWKVSSPGPESREAAVRPKNRICSWRTQYMKTEPGKLCEEVIEGDCVRPRTGRKPLSPS